MRTFAGALHLHLRVQSCQGRAGPEKRQQAIHHDHCSVMLGYGGVSEINLRPMPRRSTVSVWLMQRGALG